MLSKNNQLQTTADAFSILHSPLHSTIHSITQYSLFSSIFHAQCYNVTLCSPLDWARAFISASCFTRFLWSPPRFIYCLSFCLLSFCLFVSLPFCLFVFLSLCLFVFLTYCLFVFLQFCLFLFLHLVSSSTIAFDMQMLWKWENIDYYWDDLTGTPLKVLSVRLHSKSQVSGFTYRLALLGGSSEEKKDTLYTPKQGVLKIL